MNCFQLFIFDILTTTDQGSKDIEPGCELLSIIYLWHSDNNHEHFSHDCEAVVNCFQLFIFDILTTTVWIDSTSWNMLWIAFNYLSLTFWQQLNSASEISWSRCELLSIIYLWHSDNNTIRKSLNVSPLWIAFNYLSLTFWQQHWASFVFSAIGCELLSIIYLWHSDNNSDS